MTGPLGYDVEELGARGAAHTSKEIVQQPAVWRTVGTDVEERRAVTDEFLRPLLLRLDLRIVLTGAGSSAFIGDVLAPALVRKMRRRAEAIPTTDIVADPGGCFAEDVPTLLVSFARSGDSPESVAATEIADELVGECYHLVITCNPSGELYRRHVDAPRSLVLVMPDDANDQGFAMTSSFTSMLLTAWLTLGSDASAVETTDRLAAAGGRFLDQHGAAVRSFAQGGYERVVYLGSGPLAGIARESALKLLELSAGQVVTYSDTALGFRHGPKSVLTPGTLAVVFLSGDDYTRQYDLDIAAEIRSTIGPANVVTIGDSNSTDADYAGAFTLALGGELEDASLAALFVLFGQLFALHSSLTLGITSDNPFPSGVVNRVVTGVTIHARSE